jgi:hypothetical protein
MPTFDNMLVVMTYFNVLLQHKAEGEQTSRFVDMREATLAGVSQLARQNDSDPISAR